MTELPHQEILIIKRKASGHGEAHHGGVWKIAFADFMTAMMAFFLVLWIVNSTSKETRSSIARYFNPIKLADTTPARKGLRDPKDSDFDASADKAKEGKPAVEAAEKPDAHAEGKSGKADPHAAKKAKPEPLPAAGADEHAAKAAPEAHAAKGAKAEAGNTGGGKIGGGAGAASARLTNRQPSMSEAQLLDDPQAALAELAASETPKDALARPDDTHSSKAAAPGPASSEFQDPFEPVAPVLGARPAPGAAPTLEARAPAAAQHAGAANSAKTATAAADRQTQGAAASAEKTAADATAADAAAQAAPSLPASAAVQKLRSDVQRLVVDEFGGRKGPGIEVRRVAEGVLIALTDQQNFEMFAIGSSEPHPKLIPVMAQLARLLEKQTGHVVIRGHTDSRPFRPGTSGNWRLSASRAQMAFQMLLRGPFDEQRLERIEGRADREPLNTADGQAPENRRIEILLRTEAAP